MALLRKKLAEYEMKENSKNYSYLTSPPVSPCASSSSSSTPPTAATTSSSFSFSSFPQECSHQSKNSPHAFHEKSVECRAMMKKKCSKRESESVCCVSDVEVCAWSGMSSNVVLSEPAVFYF